MDPKEITAATAAFGMRTQSDHGVDQADNARVRVFTSAEFVNGLNDPALKNIDVRRMVEVPSHNRFEGHSLNELTDPRWRHGPSPPVRIRVGFQRNDSPRGEGSHGWNGVTS